ncbi:MAG: acetylornithine transaminase [Actinomycetes bacterium]
MTTKNERAQGRWNKTVQLNYGTPSISLAKGSGSVVWDVDGNRYLDFLGGIATTVLGHANPSVVKAVSTQIRELSHVSNFYMHEPVLQLAEKLTGFTGEKSARVFFCNSGAEANEAALKLSRLTGRTRIIALEGGFHGRTTGALALTGQQAKRLPFLPLIKDVKFAPFGDLDSLRRLISRRVAMVIVEPIQGENGVVVPPADYLKGIRELCDQYGVLMCVDAVQTGMGRTGSWFGYEYSGITPDIITLAKGLGGGLPLGAMIAVTPQAPAFKPGEHGSTFGGNPVSCAAGLAAISVIEKKKLLSRAKTVGLLIKKEISKIDGVLAVRGEGLLLGILLEDINASALVEVAKNNGLLLNAPNKGVIRIAPALSITDAQVREFIKKFSQSMALIQKGTSQ